MLAALEPTMGSELIQIFDELLPTNPWRDSIPSEHWFRADVREAMAVHSRPRHHLHESLIGCIGERHAGTLMEYLVPAPWIELRRLGVPVDDLVAPPRVA